MMGRPSKFTEPVRTRILQALQVGASHRTAAALAGVGERTLRRWLDRGRELPEDSTSSYRRFFVACEEAEAHPKARALGIIYDAMRDKPELAWRFVERREHGFSAPMPAPKPLHEGPVVIQLSLSDGRPVPLVAPDAWDVPPRITVLPVGEGDGEDEA